MKRFIMAGLIALAPLSLAACKQGEIQTPGNVADTTVLDEKAALTVENAATAITVMGNGLVRTGVIKDKEGYKALSRKLNSAVQASRAAYNTGNATGYDSAISQANAVILEITAFLNQER